MNRPDLAQTRIGFEKNGDFMQRMVHPAAEKISPDEVRTLAGHQRKMLVPEVQDDHWFSALDNHTVAQADILFGRLDGQTEDALAAGAEFKDPLSAPQADIHGADRPVEKAFDSAARRWSVAFQHLGRSNLEWAMRGAGFLPRSRQRRKAPGWARALASASKDDKARSGFPTWRASEIWVRGQDSANTAHGQQ
jgi:hypothetical protein